MQQPEQPPPLRAVPPLTAPEEPSVWIPAVPGAKALQPAKAAVYQLLIEQARLLSPLHTDAVQKELTAN